MVGQESLFAGWREELVTRRKFGPAALNHAGAPAGGRRGTTVQHKAHELGTAALPTGAPLALHRPLRNGQAERC
ncbi:hypothetical protein GCM10018966_103390 [Streptomyces yanii]